MVKRYRPFPVILSSPSGGGKSTVCSILLRMDPYLRFSVTCTTRSPRPGEKNGKDYYFLSRNQFRDAVRRGSLLEWARVHGEFYGTPRKYVEDAIRKGISPVMTIDVQGAISVKKKIPEAVSIFLLPPHRHSLHRRLIGRGESRANIRIRLKTAKEELKNMVVYDYTVVNDNLAMTTAEVLNIIAAERLKTARRLQEV
ncbi:MAG: guanylate kinase [bacterium]